ncbi:MAG: hypothetical protein K2M07_05785 [Muribaculaceae bacterium]|nr:hypothetical protein [Muribaculaceae bacterium]
MSEISSSVALIVGLIALALFLILLSSAWLIVMRNRKTIRRHKTRSHNTLKEI